MIHKRGRILNGKPEKDEMEFRSDNSFSRCAIIPWKIKKIQSRLINFTFVRFDK